jgi:hypothetical protein
MASGDREIRAVLKGIKVCSRTSWWLNFFSAVLLFAVLNWIALHFAIGSIIDRAWSQPTRVDMVVRSFPLLLTTALLFLSITRLLYRSNDPFAWGIVVCCVIQVYYRLWISDL